MEILRDRQSVNQLISSVKCASKSIGLVPTMGALHHGHISLVEESLRNNDITITTIFVNPTQFNNPEDFKNYPVSLDADLVILEETGVDYVFIPSTHEIYPEEPLINISFGHLDQVMEGEYRPGHFNGVAQVVAKIFNIVNPTRAYFGQKDLQQYKIIERLVSDLSMPVELIMMPIVREESGLAMSSRNRRLSKAGLNTASSIYKSLTKGRDLLENGADPVGVSDTLRNELKQSGILVEYIEVVDFKDLQPIRNVPDANKLALCFAGYVEDIRLIDNVTIG